MIRRNKKAAKEFGLQWAMKGISADDESKGTNRRARRLRKQRGQNVVEKGRGE
jgi:hypothetical protein